MANKKTLDELIVEVLQEEISREDWENLYGIPSDIKGMDDATTAFDADVPKDSNTLGGVNVWDAFHDKGQKKQKLDKTDIEYYKKNPDEISTTVQSRLIAISRVGESGNQSRFDKKYNPKTLAAAQNAADADPDNDKKQRTATIIQNRLAQRSYLLAMAAAAEDALSAYQKRQIDVIKRQGTITDPKLKTVGTDIPIFPEELKSAIELSMQGTKSMEDRTKKLSEISELFYKASGGDRPSMDAIKAKNPQELLADIQVLEAIAMVLKEYDSQSSAYMMESFLALLYGGFQAGKVKTSKGKQGAVDFTAKINGVLELGSAKFYKSYTGISQSAQGFVDAAHDPKSPKSITYIVGLKKQSAEQMSTIDKGATSAPEKIMGVQIHLVKYSISKPELDDKNSAVLTNTSTGDAVQYTKDDKLDISSDIKAGASTQYPLYLAQLRTKTFREMVDGSINEELEGVGQAYQYFKQYYDNLKEASVNAKQYINKGTLANGQKVYDNLTNAETNYTGLVNQLTYEDKPTVQENKKKSLKDLDKLIERVIIEHMHK